MELADFLKPISLLPIDEIMKSLDDYYYIEGSLIPSATFNHWMGGLDMTGVMEDVASEKGHPARHKMASVRLNIMAGEPFNFIQSSQTGRGTIDMINGLISDSMVEYAEPLTMLLNMGIAYANKKVFPFKQVSKHEVLVHLNQCPVKPVSSPDGYVVITTKADAPLHSPNLWAEDPRNFDKLIRINLFKDVSVAGTYESQVPRNYFGLKLFVDDAYGVI